MSKNKKIAVNVDGPKEQILTTNRVINTPPTVRFYGCGGCGIKLAKRVGELINKEDEIFYVDASTANFVGLESDNKFALATSGSGKLRATNITEIQNNVNKFDPFADGKSIPDINIFIFSASGGSGSVCAPLLMKRVIEKGSIAVAIPVVDYTAEGYAKNTKGTIRTLDGIAKAMNLSMPVALFDNRDGENIVDVELTTLCKDLYTLLTTDCTEIDRNDRRNWLKPHTLGHNIDVGLRMFHVFNPEKTLKENDSIVWEYNPEFIYDAGVFLASSSEGNRPTVDVRTPYRGVYVGNTQTAALCAIMGSSATFFSTFAERLESSINKFNVKENSDISDMFGGSEDEVSNGGIIIV